MKLNNFIIASKFCYHLRILRFFKMYFKFIKVKNLNLKSKKFGKTLSKILYKI